MFIVPKKARTTKWYKRRINHYAIVALVPFAYFSSSSHPFHEITGIIIAILAILLAYQFISMIFRVNVPANRIWLNNILLILLLLVVISGYALLTSEHNGFIPTPNILILQDNWILLKNIHETLVNIFLIVALYHLLKALWLWSKSLRKKLMQHFSKKTSTNTK